MIAAEPPCPEAVYHHVSAAGEHWQERAVTFKVSFLEVSRRAFLKVSGWERDAGAGGSLLLSRHHCRKHPSTMRHAVNKPLPCLVGIMREMCRLSGDHTPPPKRSGALFGRGRWIPFSKPQCTARSASDLVAAILPARPKLSSKWPSAKSPFVFFHLLDGCFARLIQEKGGMERQLLLKRATPPDSLNPLCLLWGGAEVVVPCLP